MLFIVYSLFSEKYIAANLGVQEYSYYFVLKKYLPLLRQLGEVVVVENPALEVDPLYAEAKSRQQACLYLSFTAPQNTVIGLACPTVSVFAWEFDSIPNEIFEDDERSDWTFVFDKIAGIITHSRFAVRTLKTGLPERYPVVSVPAPVWDRYTSLYRKDSATQLLERQTIVVNCPVLDTREIDLSVVEKFLYPDLAEGEDDCEAAADSHLQSDVARGSGRTTALQRLRAWGREIIELIPQIVSPQGFASAGRAEVGPGNNSVYYCEALSDNLADHNPRTAELGPVLKQLTSFGENRLELQGVIYTAIFNPHDGRKNWHDMVSAFCRGLKDCEDAVLVIKLIHRDSENMLKDLIHALYQLEPFKCRVIVIDGHLDKSTYEQLIHATSYIVNSSFCEGQCLPLMEFMSAGTPAIAPCNTGMEDYINDKVAFVVDCSKEYHYFPQDPRKALRTCQYRINWESLQKAYELSYRVAKEEPGQYRAMAAAAVAQLQTHCSMDVLVESLRSFFQSSELQARMNEGHPRQGKEEPAQWLQTLRQPDPGIVRYRDSLPSGWLNKEAREVCQGFAIEDDDVVLDIGCGNEAVTLFCAELGAKLLFTGSDKSTMVEMVKKIRKSTPLSFRALLSDDNPIPLRSGSASRIIMLDVLQRHGDPMALLKEAVRVGRPGARYLLAVPAAGGEDLLSLAGTDSRFDGPNPRHVFQPSDFEHMVVSAGLMVEYRQVLGFYWTLWSCFASAIGGNGDEPDKLSDIEKDAMYGHPLLTAWAKTWQALVDIPGGDRTRHALDQALPKTQVLIAVKGSDQR